MATLQTKILQYLESLDYCWVVKVISSNKRGCPDILCCYYGMFVAIEVKETGATTDIQEAQLKLIHNKAQGWSFVARKPGEVEGWMKFLKGRAKTIQSLMWNTKGVT